MPSPSPPTSHPCPCHQATVVPLSHGPVLSCGFIIGRDGKQNHHRMKDGEKGGKASYKILAALQIEKVREREKEDSPLTKPCAHRILHHPGNLKKKEKRKKAQHRSERELIALLLYLLGFVANDFHIATSNALDALRKKEEGERQKRVSHVISRTQTNKLTNNGSSVTHCQVTQEHLFIVFATRDEKQR